MPTRFQIRWTTPRFIVESTNDRILAYLQTMLGRVQSDLVVEDVQTAFDRATGKLRVMATVNLTTSAADRERIGDWLTEVLESDQSPLRPNCVTIDIVPDPAGE